MKNADRSSHIMRLVAAAIAASICMTMLTLCVYAGPVDRGRIGQNPKCPPGYTRVENDDLVLTGEPVVTMTDTFKALISFETVSSCPAATVYYGVYEPGVKLPFPRFRSSVKEKFDGYRKKHEVKLKLKKLADEEIDVTDLRAKRGGVIACRIELYDPEEARSFIVDRRFAFRENEIIPVIIEGPFIDLVTPNSATISWDCNPPAKGFVKIDQRIIEPDTDSVKTHFEIAVQGLNPGSTHNYSIATIHKSDTTFSKIYNFRTPQPDEVNFQFAVLGDSQADKGGGDRDRCGVNAGVLNSLTVDAFNHDVDFIIQMGDQVHGFTTSPLDMRMQLRSYKYAIEPVAHYLPIYEIMGNHNLLIDYYRDGKKKFRCDKAGDVNSESVFAEAFVNPVNAPQPESDRAPSYDETAYYYDYGNCRFVILNTEYWHADAPEKNGGNLQGYILDNQAKWAERVFTDATVNPDIEHLFMMAHEPFFPNGPHVNDALWYDGGNPDKNKGIDRTYVVQRRNEIWGAFVNTGKAVCGIFGHEHCYNRSRITSDICADYAYPAWQIISGGGGGPFYAQVGGVPWEDAVEVFSIQNHFLLLTVKGSRIMLEVISLSGELIDRVELVE